MKYYFAFKDGVFSKSNIIWLTFAASCATPQAHVTHVGPNPTGDKEKKSKDKFSQAAT